MGKRQNPQTLEYFRHSDRDQLDHLFFPFLKSLLGQSFDLYPKSVCFKDNTEKLKYKGVRPVSYPERKPIGKTCVCSSSFFTCSRKVKNQFKPYLALVEGKIGRIDPSKLPNNVTPVKSTCHEFHCCVVIVDPRLRRVSVFNPWKAGQVRSGNVTRVCDIRPRLVRDLVAKYKGYKKFHLSGDQVGSSDCRIRVAQFARTLGKEDGRHYSTKFNWVKLS
jgi:hypothetical protein